MDRARLQNRTALLIDNSADHLVDTYYTYQSALVVEAKQLVLDEATGRCTHEQILEALRTTLVNAMRYGQVRVATGAACGPKAAASVCLVPAPLQPRKVPAPFNFSWGPAGASCTDPATRWRRPYAWRERGR